MRFKRNDPSPMNSGVKKSTNPFDQLAAKPKSKALAIKTMCAHCVGCTQNRLESGFRTLIAECEVFACPLHAFRPYAAKRVLNRSQDAVADDYAEESERD